jgi:carbon monoxide dehydrogenase subunit G
MKLEQSFTVAAPVEQVWDALIDVQRVAPCLPGAEVTEVGDDGTYHGTFSVKLGPTTAAYRGTLRLEDVDAAGRRVTMSARGTDKRGQGGASATIVSFLSEDPDGTRVEVDTDFTITGRLARFGRGGMIEDISRRLLGEFSSCLQQTLATRGQTPPAAPDAPVEPAVAPEPATEMQTGEPAPAPAPPPPAQPAAAPPPPAQPAKPLNAFRLLLQVLGDRIRRLFGRRA